MCRSVGYDYGAFISVKEDGRREEDGPDGRDPVVGSFAYGKGSQRVGSTSNK